MQAHFLKCVPIPSSLEIYSDEICEWKTWKHWKFYKHHPSYTFLFWLGKYSQRSRIKSGVEFWKHCVMRNFWFHLKTTFQWVKVNDIGPTYNSCCSVFFLATIVHKRCCAFSLTSSVAEYVALRWVWKWWVSNVETVEKLVWLLSVSMQSDSPFCGARFACWAWSTLRRTRYRWHHRHSVAVWGHIAHCRKLEFFFIKYKTEQNYEQQQLIF